MNYYLRFILPLYCTVYFLFLFIIRAWNVRQQIGKNPIQLSFSDDLHGLISKYFASWMLLLLCYTLIYSVYPSAYSYFKPFVLFTTEGIQITGLLLLAIALIGTYLAQADMRQSWRVGIDQQQKTELVTNGIFKYSRNPIYVGMLAAVIGLVLVTPNAFTLLLAVVGYVLVQVQVRVEEEFLLKMHGQSYQHYKASVRRFI